MSAAPPAVQAALYYAARGLAVFPCAPASKAPHAMLGDRGGLHHATTEPAIIGGWWGSDPRARIGLNLGASGLIAFDLEGPAKGYDPAAIIAALCETYGPDALPATWQAVTPSGGRHLLYRAPEGEVPNTLPLEVEGLDRIRHGGSYVVVPAVVAGEIVPDEDGRKWLTGPTPLAESEPAPAPSWLEDVARETARARRKARAAVRARGRRPDDVDATPYGEKALMGLWGEVANAPEGLRHSTLTRAAVRARALEAGGHVTGEKWREVLAHAAERCGLPEVEVYGDPERGRLGILECAATVATVDPAGPERKGAAA